jgi:uncharacterized FlaG/YvyC family protein
MDKVGPILPRNIESSEEKYRKELSAKFNDLPENPKNQSQKHKNRGNLQHADYHELLKYVDEVNAQLTGLGQNILVLINKNEDKITLTIIDTKNHENISEITPDDLFDLAQNLRNQKLTLIDRDV